MRDVNKKYYSSLYCTECGLRMTIPRYRGSKRKEGHIKTMWCANCNDMRDFVENNYRPLEVIDEQ